MITYPIYMDYQSTTPTDPRVMQAMLPYFTDKFGNPHSRSHIYGWESEAAVEEARDDVARLIGASAKEIIFTSGATEANNMAIRGVAQFYKSKKRHIVTLVTEHKCVLESCRQLEREGFDVTYLEVEPDGLVSMEQLRKAITDETLLVSIMAINNEIGVIQPIEEIGKLCRERGVFFHTDAAQAYGKVPLNVDDMCIDLMSISAHKAYGPKGIGALYIRRRPRVRIEPLFYGGGQERGLRSGTLPTPLVVGFGKAADIAAREMEEEAGRIASLSKRFWDGLTQHIDYIALNGHPTKRWAGNVNISFDGMDEETIMSALKHLAVSSGSACNSASLEPSYILRALGVPEDALHSSIRFGIGRFTTEEEIDQVVDMMVAQLDGLSRTISSNKQAARA